jgi:hypothetical protein
VAQGKTTEFGAALDANAYLALKDPRWPTSDRISRSLFRQAWTSKTPAIRAFIAYSRADRVAAKKLRDLLISEGYKVFTYLDEATGQLLFSERATAKALLGADICIVLDTTNARNSPSVQAEMQTWREMIEAKAAQQAREDQLEAERRATPEFKSQEIIDKLAAQAKQLEQADDRFMSGQTQESERIAVSLLAAFVQARDTALARIRDLRPADEKNILDKIKDLYGALQTAPKGIRGYDKQVSEWRHRAPIFDRDPVRPGPRPPKHAPPSRRAPVMTWVAKPTRATPSGTWSHMRFAPLTKDLPTAVWSDSTTASNNSAKPNFNPCATRRSVTTAAMPAASVAATSAIAPIACAVRAHSTPDNIKPANTACAKIAATSKLVMRPHHGRTSRPGSLDSVGPPA